MSYSVSSLKIAKQSGSDSTYYASWSFSKTHVVSYTVTWKYATGDGLWFDGGSSSVTLKNATYSAPSNATRIKVTVKPVSDTYTVTTKTPTTTSTSSGSKTVSWSGYTPTVSSGSSSSDTTYTTTTTEVNYWTGSSKSVTYNITNVPEEPSAPTLELGTVYSETCKLIASVDTTDSYTSGIQFVFYRATSVSANYTKVTTVSSIVSGGQATVQKTLDNGYYYKVRCRGYRTVSGKTVYGDYSDYSDEITTPPDRVTNVKVTAASETSIKVSWTASSTATKYTVEYVPDTDDIAGYKLFDTGSSEVQEVTEITKNYTFLTGLESGHKYYVRVKALNDDDQESTWVGTSGGYYCVIGTTPEAPTTWSSTTTAYLSGSSTQYVYLYFTHNCEDGSELTNAKLTYKFDSGSYTTVEGPYSSSNPHGYYLVDDESGTGYFKYGIGSWDPNQDFSSTVMTWKVATEGITNEYGDWSTARTVNIYEEPTLTVSTDDTFTSFPLSITMSCGPSEQQPLSITYSISSLTNYTGTNYDGTAENIRKGQQIYSNTLTVSSSTTARNFGVSISAGLINLEDGQQYRITAVVAMDSGLSAEATCDFDCEFEDSDYDVNGVVAIERDTLCALVRPWCEEEDETVCTKSTMMLSVYRREPDGSFTEIETNISSSYGGNLMVVDPHPSLDYARYRIVAIDMTTSKVYFSDLPNYPVLEPSIIIQWDEDWQNFDISDESYDDATPWAGSMVKLPYNVDVQESNDIDVSLVEYIGRENPVSYYGTQKGYTASWSTEILKSDKEMLYALRRLAKYAGDVYVREPSGTGFWAQVSVSIDIKHCELTVPVSFEITRVEGGA